VVHLPFISLALNSLRKIGWNMSQYVQTRIHEIKEGMDRDIKFLRSSIRKLNFGQRYRFGGKYMNVLIALRHLDKHIKDLRFILCAKPNKEIEQFCDDLENSIIKITDAITGNADIGYDISAYLKYVKHKFMGLSEMLAEFQQIIGKGNEA